MMEGGSSILSGMAAEAVAADFSALGKLNVDQFNELLDVVFSFLTTKQAVELVDSLEKYAEKHTVKLSVLKSCSKTLMALPGEAIKKGMTSSQLSEELTKLGLNEEKVSCFVKKWTDNYASIANTSLKDTVSINQLVDLEWKFGVTAASSEQNEVGNTFLQLKLVVDKGNKQLENVCMELTMAQFYAFLHEMEMAKNALDCLT